MSIWMSASSSPNRKLASAFDSSVLPPPDGPAKMNEPDGRLGSFRTCARAADRLRDRPRPIGEPLVVVVEHPGDGHVDQHPGDAASPVGGMSPLPTVEAARAARPLSSTARPARAAA